MEKTILEDSDRTIHQDYTNVNELYDNIIRIVTGSGTAEYDNS
jgi:hypothetical protein